MTATANDLLIGPVVVAAAVDTIAVDFLVEDESWLEVYKSGSETPLILNTDYTFTGEGTDSGTVTLTVPADGVDSYSVYLVQPKERNSDLQFRGDFRSGPLNLELDRVWRAIQGLDTALDRTLKISKVSSIVAPLDTETAIERALGTLSFSADGTQLLVGPTTTQIVDATAATAASEAAAAADAAAAAAALSAADAAATAAAISAATALDTLLNYTGAWLTATAYDVNDLVTEAGSTYICVEAHTSGTFATDLAAVKWQIFAQKGTAGAGSGDVVAANNLSDLASAVSALVNLGVSSTAAELNILDGVTATTAEVNHLVGVTSGIQAQINAVGGSPAGTVILYAANAAPSGFLKANGALVSRTTYATLFAAIGTTFGVGDGSTTFGLPDLRGEFLRAWDDSRGIDSGRVFGSAQSDLFKSHTHRAWTNNSSTGNSNNAPVYTGAGLTGETDGSDSFDNSGLIENTGGAETRPRNIALLACIKF